MKDGGGILAGGGTIGSGKASLEDAGGAVAGGGAEGTDDAGGDGGGDGVTEGGTDGAQDDLATAPAGTVAAITVTAADDTTLVAANTTTAADDATLIAAVAAVLPKRSTPRAGGDTDGLSIQRRTTPPDPGDSGTRAVPDSPVQVNSMRCEWEFYDAEAVERSPDGRSVTARFDLTQAVALGSPESQPSTVTTWNIRIDESRLNQGGAMCIGVCDVRAPLPSLPAPAPAPARQAAHRSPRRAQAEAPTKGGPIRGNAVGFNPFSGALLRSADGNVVPYSETDGQKLMRGDLQGRANGTVVRMRHNARRGTLSFNIDGESWVEATQTRVPARVRPWVHMFKGDDRVTIVAATQRQSAGARGSRLA